eukprot:CAMPEP_0198657822 /NCGR_PEP_ID=MMETSP1467-20131203/20156_1 /TAXON_ID=1462469 /ORGANISM="unid. sp., Strain CCMP2135" /LENGTH=290 /DNA_ID=CAMNT_0044394049 /DNA_START=15 /DNA_END=887 /DNA_ORIENTATION=-
MTSTKLLLPRRVGGLKEGPVMCFMAGWPDDERSFEVFEEAFGSEFKTLSVCLPGFSATLKQEVPRWGYSLDSVTQMLRDTVVAEVGGDEKVVLVCHDWGSYFGLDYCQKFPVSKFVSLDVGVYSPFEHGLKAVFLDVLYKGCLACGFALRALGLPSVGALLVGLFPWRTLGPCPFETAVPPRAKEFFTPQGFDVATCYPYFRLFTKILSSPFSGDNWPAYPRGIPTLFLYGKNKRVMFHSAAFLRTIDAEPGSAHKAYDCGHFIQAQQPHQAIADIKAFLSVTSLSPAAP